MKPNFGQIQWSRAAGRLTQEPEVPGSIPGPAKFFRPLPLTQEQLSVTGKVCHEVLVNRSAQEKCD